MRPAGEQVEKMIFLKIRMKDSVLVYTKLKYGYPNNECFLRPRPDDT